VDFALVLFENQITMATLSKHSIWSMPHTCQLATSCINIAQLERQVDDFTELDFLKNDTFESPTNNLLPIQALKTLKISLTALFVFTIDINCWSTVKRAHSRLLVKSDDFVDAF
jgi:hypothetical protein